MVVLTVVFHHAYTILGAHTVSCSVGFSIVADGLERGMHVKLSKHNTDKIHCLEKVFIKTRPYPSSSLLPNNIGIL